MRPKFSIIIPLYNKAPYVRKALESVVSQTYKDWECIIVDDGSTDGSAAICEEYLSTLYTIHHTPSEKIRIISQPNSGVSTARNNGVAQSQGDYLAFLDADDWWEPTFLEQMAQLIDDYPDAGLYATNYIYYKPGKTHVALNIPTGYINYSKAYYESGAMPVCTGATMIPRPVFEEMGGFPQGIKLGEDFLLWAKIATRYRVAFGNQPLAYYNNDVPATMRATRNLHAPEHHMLFNLATLEQDIELRVKTQELKEDWKALLDKLRVNGLMDYGLDARYHDLAAEELSKVDWSRQPQSIVRRYQMPIWYLKVHRRFMQIGSFVKQRIIKITINDNQ